MAPKLLATQNQHPGPTNIAELSKDELQLENDFSLNTNSTEPDSPGWFSPVGKFRKISNDLTNSTLSEKPTADTSIQFDLDTDISSIESCSESFLTNEIATLFSKHELHVGASYIYQELTQFVQSQVDLKDHQKRYKINLIKQLKRNLADSSREKDPEERSSELYPLEECEEFLKEEIQSLVYKGDADSKYKGLMELLLGRISFRKGKSKDSLRYFSSALKILEDVLEENHPIIAEVHRDLGNLFSHNGLYGAALNHYSKSLDHLTQLLGNNYEQASLGALYMKIGSTYQKQNRVDLAINSYLKGLDIQLKTLGELDPEVARSFLTIGELCFKNGLYYEAANNIKQGMSIEMKLCGETHPKIAYFHNLLSFVYSNQGGLNFALEAQIEAMKIDIKSLNVETPMTALSQNMLGMLCYHAGRYDEALENYEKSLNFLKSVVGDDHPMIA